MAIQRSIIIIGRHGVAPKNADGSSMDSISDASIQSMYGSARDELKPLVQSLGITLQDAFVRGSGKVRTMYTGKAKAIGAFGLERKDEADKRSCPEYPVSSADLANFNFDGVSIEEDPRFNFGDPYLNMEVYKATGGAGNINYGLQNPTARTHDGKPIETYESISTRTRFGVQDMVRRVLDDKKRFGIVTSHATVVEPALIHLVNSERVIPVLCVEDIGGMFAQEEHAQLVIDQTDGGTYTAALVIKGQD